MLYIRLPFYILYKNRNGVTYNSNKKNVRVRVKTQ